MTTFCCIAGLTAVCKVQADRFPETELRSLDESYGAEFDLGRLRAELK